MDLCIANWIASDSLVVDPKLSEQSTWRIDRKFKTAPRLRWHKNCTANLFRRIWSKFNHQSNRVWFVSRDLPVSRNDVLFQTASLFFFPALFNAMLFLYLF